MAGTDCSTVHSHDAARASHSDCGNARHIKDTVPSDSTSKDRPANRYSLLENSENFCSLHVVSNRILSADAGSPSIGKQVRAVNIRRYMVTSSL